MIAHALGLGLYEKKKLWWLKEEEWKQCECYKSGTEIPK